MKAKTWHPPNVSKKPMQDPLTPEISTRALSSAPGYVKDVEHIQ